MSDNRQFDKKILRDRRTIAKVFNIPDHYVDGLPTSWWRRLVQHFTRRP